MVSDPGEPPRWDPANRSDPLNSHVRSRSEVVVLLTAAGLIAFTVTPILCVLAWLHGYGPGGINELRSGDPIREMLMGIVFFSPVHFLALLVPGQRKTKAIGYAVSAVVVLLMSCFWFIAAAAISSV